METKRKMQTKWVLFGKLLIAKMLLNNKGSDSTVKQMFKGKYHIGKYENTSNKQNSTKCQVNLLSQITEKRFDLVNHGKQKKALKISGICLITKMEQPLNRKIGKRKDIPLR